MGLFVEEEPGDESATTKHEVQTKTLFHHPIGMIALFIVHTKYSLIFGLLHPDGFPLLLHNFVDVDVHFFGAVPSL